MTKCEIVDQRNAKKCGCWLFVRLRQVCFVLSGTSPQTNQPETCAPSLTDWLLTKFCRVPLPLSLCFCASELVCNNSGSLDWLLLVWSCLGLRAIGLKKGIFGKPSPYVKLSIIPSRRHHLSWKQHHGQIAKTSSQNNTINPLWVGEVCWIGGNLGVWVFQRENWVVETVAISRWDGSDLGWG